MSPGQTDVKELETQEAPSSPSDASSVASESSDEEDSRKPVETKFRAAPIRPPRVRLSRSELESDDIELWLISIPHHDTLRASLQGCNLRVGKRRKGSARRAERMGVLKGSYVFTDHGNADELIRAGMVTMGEEDKPEFTLGKPFARSVSVSFDTDLISLSSKKVAAKRYPEIPKGLKRQYIPIGGSEAADARDERPEKISSIGKSREEHGSKRSRTT